MKTLSSLILSLALASGAMAGSATYSGKGAVAPAPPEASCFTSGFDLGFFGGGFLPRNTSDNYDNALGGGVLADYFFNEYVGVEVSYGAFATSGTQHLFNGDIILRAPIQSACIAPYLMVGGGFHVDGSTLGEFHAGAGVEARLRSINNMGIFADGAYYWHSSGNRDEDFTLVRVGVKFHL